MAPTMFLNAFPEQLVGKTSGGVGQHVRGILATTTTIAPVTTPSAPGNGVDTSQVWVLYTCTTLFFVVAIFCLFEFVRNHGLSCSSADSSGEESTGWATRKVFHMLLFVANLSRGVALVVEIMLHDSLSKRDAWPMSLTHAFPDLAFLSTYSFLVLFFAQSYYSSKGRVVANLNTYFFVANLIVYLSCIIIAIYTGPGGSSKYAEFRLLLEYILASIFGLSGLGVFFYGYSIIRELQRTGGVQYPEQRALMKRVGIVSFVCVSLFLCRSVYGFVFGANNSADMGYPSSWRKNRYLVDGIEYTLVELLPSVVILIVTRRRERSSNDEQQLLRTPGYDAYPAAENSYRTFYGGGDGGLSGGVDESGQGSF
jgi:hypothetical protein